MSIHNFQFPVKLIIKRETGAASAQACFYVPNSEGQACVVERTVYSYEGGGYTAIWRASGAIYTNGSGTCADPELERTSYSPELLPGQSHDDWVGSVGAFVSSVTTQEEPIDDAAVLAAARGAIVWTADTDLERDHVDLAGWLNAGIEGAGVTLSRAEASAGGSATVDRSRIKIRKAGNGMRHIRVVARWDGGSVVVPSDGSFTDWIEPSAPGSLEVTFGIGMYD